MNLLATTVIASKRNGYVTTRMTVEMAVTNENVQKTNVTSKMTLLVEMDTA